jgi:hypothetical protein
MQQQTEAHNNVCCCLFLSRVPNCFRLDQPGIERRHDQDPGGAVIPAARVVVRNVATGATSETVTSSAGSYTIPNLNAGSYNLTLSGFKPVEQRNGKVQVGADVHGSRCRSWGCIQ